MIALRQIGIIAALFFLVECAGKSGHGHHHSGSKGKRRPSFPPGSSSDSDDDSGGGGQLTYQVYPLAFPDDALAPSIGELTMTFHHDRHYAAYVDKTNTLAKELPRSSLSKLQTLLTSEGPLRNNAGGAYNHGLFFSTLIPESFSSTSDISDKLLQAIEAEWSSVDALIEEMKEKGASRFGSGWVWLIADPSTFALSTVTTPYQDNPIMPSVNGSPSKSGFPIFGIDVWEHAYYLDYQNMRDAYLSAIWNVVNWEQVSENYAFVTREKKPVPARFFEPQESLQPETKALNSTSLLRDMKMGNEEDEKASDEDESTEAPEEREGL